MKESMSMIVAFAKAAETGEIGEVSWTDDVPRKARLITCEIDKSEPTTAWATYESGGERFVVKMIVQFTLALHSPGGKMID